GYYSNVIFIHQTRILHWDGIAWSIVSSPNQGTERNELRSVAVASSNDAWAVGYYLYYNGTYYEYRTLTEHWDGSQWSVVTSPNPDNNQNFLYGVAAVSANDVWAVGYYGSGTLTEHWNGSQWS